MKIYNSLSKKKEEFVTITPKEIKIYVCGQTVYDFCHLGHARKAVVFDMIRRWFITSGFHVIFVENITDIDDKIINKAIENNESIQSLTSKYINFMHEDFSKLGIMPPDFQPKATEHIPEMIILINNLIEKGYAYVGNNGDVFYRVRKFKKYGELSGMKLEDLNSGSRIEVDINKEDSLDFVLWKSAKPNEQHWNSPFGKGRPGWHIECSAMSLKTLGSTFDIHGGGLDLQFPHHENEIAQSEADTDCKLANYWIHNGFLNIDNEKMSKSLGNFLTLRDVLTIIDPEVLRLFILKTHYRSPLNFNFSVLEETKGLLTKLYLCIKGYEVDKNINVDWNNEYAIKFKLAMEDDFNTPLALNIIYEICNKINITKNHELVLILIKLSNILGIMNYSSEEYLQSQIDISISLITEQIELRNKAKIEKNFQLADQIRQDLLKSNIILEDSPTGTSWRKKN